MKQRRNWAPVVGLLAGVGAVFAYFAMVTRPDAALRSQHDSLRSRFDTEVARQHPESR